MINKGLPYSIVIEIPTIKKKYITKPVFLTGPYSFLMDFPNVNLAAAAEKQDLNIINYNGDYTIIPRAFIPMSIIALVTEEEFNKEMAMYESAKKILEETVKTNLVKHEPEEKEKPKENEDEEFRAILNNTDFPEESA